MKFSPIRYSTIKSALIWMISSEIHFRKSAIIFLLPVNTQPIFRKKNCNVRLGHLTPIIPGMPLHFSWRTNGSVTSGKGSLTTSGGCHCGLLRIAAKWSPFFLNLSAFYFYFVPLATFDLVSDLARMYWSEVGRYIVLFRGPRFMQKIVTWSLIYKGPVKIREFQ